MNLEKLLKKLVRHLKDNNINYPLSLVGSASNSIKYNDIDLLMIVDNIKLVQKIIEESFNQYNVTICDDAIKIENYYNNKISIGLYSNDNFDELINSYILGKRIQLTHRIWCLGYWILEGFTTDLANMKIINDNNNYLIRIKNTLLKDNIYYKKSIVKECLDEISYKRNLLIKCDINSLEYSYYKNDIILCIVRGLSIVNGAYLKGFKSIDMQVKKLNNSNLNRFLNNEIEALDKIVDVFNNYILRNSLYLGTWQYSGDFKKLTEKDISLLIKYAKEKGINRFDTALVYGKGKVEKILGNSLSNTDIVLTKIPAKEKPRVDDIKEITSYYDYDYIIDCITKSCSNLKRKSVDICLLHNWALEWNKENILLEYLTRLKKDGYAKKVGISLPNNFNHQLPINVLKIIDVLEVPFNRENTWIENSIDEYKKYGIEIILRSLFLQGKENKSLYEKILKYASSLNTFLVIGMTTEEQIDKNVNFLKEL